jgi:DNA-binding LytR/AlgR family response regulator
LSRNETLRAIVVDDEPLARDELTFLLSECGQVEVVGEARDAAAALDLAEKMAPDVAFVDLRMPGPDGIALAQALRSRNRDLDVVVVSAHDDGAIRAYETGVIDYLLKPVRLERLKATLDRVRGSSATSSSREAEPESLDRLAVRRKGAYVVVEIGDVIYFEVKDELVWAVTADDRYALDLSLSAVEKRLSEDKFFRSHRGALVRIDKIRAIEPSGTGTYELVMDHKEVPRVPLARERARLLRAKIPFAG